MFIISVLHSTSVTCWTLLFLYYYFWISFCTKLEIQVTYAACSCSTTEYLYACLKITRKQQMVLNVIKNKPRYDHDEDSEHCAIALV